MEEKTLFLSNSLSLGGLEKATVSIANALSSEMDITLYSLKGNSFQYSLNPLLTYKEASNLKKFYLFHPISVLRTLNKNNLYKKKQLNFKKIRQDLNLKSYKNIILSEADILYAKNIKSISPRCNLIGWIHSNFDSYKDIYFKDTYHDFLENLKYIDKLIVLSEEDKLKYKGIHNNVYKIENPLTMTKVNKKELNEEVKFKTISFVGRMDWNIKGLDYLLRIIEEIPSDWKVSIAGDGKDFNRFINSVEEKNLVDKVIIRGILKGEKLVKHYVESDIFILTSRFEGFGLVITEAMCCGLPVISFDSPGPREIIGSINEYGILVENGNIEIFIKEIIKMISDNNLRLSYSKKSFERVDKYSINMIRMKWMNLLC